MTVLLDNKNRNYSGADICVFGGAWHRDKDVLAQANPDIYKQRPLLPLE